MTLSSFLVPLFGALSLTFSTVGSVPHRISQTGSEGSGGHITSDAPSIYLAAVKCKAGLKPAKTPISLVPGAKVGCIDPKKAALGKKLLTSDYTQSCFACHAAGGIAPSTMMNSNLRAQGYTLTPANITAAFNAHLAQMTNATLTPKNTALIIQYLESIK